MSWVDRTKKFRRALLLGAGGLAALTACAGPAASADELRPAALTQSTCTASSLHLSVVGTDTAVGTTVMTVAVTSASAGGCTLQGYPTLAVLDSQGKSATVTAGRGAGPMFAAAATPVTLSSGSGVSFYLAYRTFVPSTGETCPAQSGLRVTLPGLSGGFTVNAPLAPCGSVAVSALRPGTGGE
jgi:hypothetical protein